MGFFLLIEVVADDTPAVDVVLKSDTKREELLKEMKELEEEAAKGSLKKQDRLNEVWVLSCYFILYLSIFFFFHLLMISLDLILSSLFFI